MGVIGCGDGNHINLVSESLKHLPVVLEKLGALVLRKPGVDQTTLSIHIAEAEHLHVLVLGNSGRVHAPLTAGADMCGANTAIRRVGK